MTSFSLAFFPTELSEPEESQQRDWCLPKIIQKTKACARGRRFLRSYFLLLKESKRRTLLPGPLWLCLPCFQVALLPRCNNKARCLHPTRVTVTVCKAAEILLVWCLMLLSNQQDKLTQPKHKLVTSEACQLRADPSGPCTLGRYKTGLRVSKANQCYSANKCSFVECSFRLLQSCMSQLCNTVTLLFWNTLKCSYPLHILFNIRGNLL